MPNKKNDYPTVRELTYRNAEKIDLLLEEIRELKQKMDCIISIKEDLARHKAYFKILGVGIVAMISLLVSIIAKIL